MKLDRNKLTAVFFSVIFVLNFWSVKLPIDILFFTNMSLVYFFSILVWSVLSISYYKKSISVNTISIPFAVYTFYFVIQSVFFSLSPAISMPYTFLLSLWFLTFTAFLFFGSKFDINYSLKLIYILCLMVLIFSIISLLPKVLSNNLSYNRLQVNNFSNKISSINGVSVQCVFLFLIGIYLKKINYIKKNLLYFGSLIFFVFIILSGSRTATGIFILMLILNIIFTLFTKTYLFKIKSKHILFLFLLAPLTLLFLDLDFILSKFNRVTERTAGHMDLVNRTGFYKFIFHDFVDKSFINKLFGSGIETYRYVKIKNIEMITSKYKLHTIHSEFLQIIYGGGIFGFFIYLFFISFIGYKLLLIKDKLLKLLLINIFTLNIVYLLVQPGPINRIFLFFLPVLISNYQKTNKTI